MPSPSFMQHCIPSACRLQKLSTNFIQKSTDKWGLDYLPCQPRVCNVGMESVVTLDHTSSKLKSLLVPGKSKPSKSNYFLHKISKIFVEECTWCSLECCLHLSKKFKECCYHSLRHYSELLPWGYTYHAFREVVPEQCIGALSSCELDTISCNAA